MNAHGRSSSSDWSGISCEEDASAGKLSSFEQPQLRSFLGVLDFGRLNSLSDKDQSKTEDLLLKAQPIRDSFVYAPSPSLGPLALVLDNISQPASQLEYHALRLIVPFGSLAAATRAFLGAIR